MSYQSVDLYYEPELICNQVTNGENRIYSEMSLFQQAFLCGLLKEKKPKKVVEIGVAGGGTTAVILTCLKVLENDSEMYSVDLAEKWYRTGNEDTGFLAKKYIDDIIGKTRHQFLLGKSIPYVIDKIGGEIDFLILDTTHVMPGEFLDFLVCLPYLKKGCVVVLHDVMENHLTCCRDGMATKLLFQLIRGKKWYMHEEDLDLFEFSNIAACELEREQDIENLFLGLTFSWAYMLDGEEKYIDIISKNYEKQFGESLKRILKLQKYTELRKQINLHYHMEHTFLKLKWEKEKAVFLYGTGYWAKIYSEYARINHLEISGYVISDAQEIVNTNNFEKPIYRLKDLPYSSEQCAFVLALDRKHFTCIKKNLADRGYNKIL